MDNIDVQMWLAANENKLEVCKDLFQKGANINMAIMGASDVKNKEIQMWAWEQGACYIFSLQQKPPTTNVICFGDRYSKNISMLHGPGEVPKDLVTLLPLPSTLCFLVKNYLYWNPKQYAMQIPMKMSFFNVLEVIDDTHIAVPSSTDFFIWNVVTQKIRHIESQVENIDFVSPNHYFINKNAKIEEIKWEGDKRHVIKVYPCNWTQFLLVGQEREWMLTDLDYLLNTITNEKITVPQNCQLWSRYWIAYYDQAHITLFQLPSLEKIKVKMPWHCAFVKIQKKIILACNFHGQIWIYKIQSHISHEIQICWNKNKIVFKRPSSNAMKCKIREVMQLVDNRLLCVVQKKYVYYLVTIDPYQKTCFICHSIQNWMEIRVIDHMLLLKTNKDILVYGTQE